MVACNALAKQSSGVGDAINPVAVGGIPGGRASEWAVMAGLVQSVPHAACWFARPGDRPMVRHRALSSMSCRAVRHYDQAVCEPEW